MRRIIAFILISISLVILLKMDVYAQARVVVREQITITVDRAIVTTDVPPINVMGQTLVPIRSVFEAFDADIDWFPAEKRVFLRKDCQVVWLRIGDTRAKVDDAYVTLAVPAMIYRGRTMVPLRFIAESLGATVNWDPATQTITIVTRSTGQAAPQQTAPSDQPTY